MLPPQTESCENELDDDCDGKIDASDPDCFACTAGQQDDCIAAGAQGICRNGLKTCTAAGSWDVCVAGSPMSESCDNSQDDDCDGTAGYNDTDCLIPIYRQYNASTGDHMVSFISTEGSSVGYTSEGVLFKLLVSAVGGSKKALYRCLVNGDHFVSGDPSCEGYSVEALMGYAFTSQQPGTFPMYRCYNSSVGDHLTTKNPAECQQYNYTVEFTLGYVK